jgi:hypothetical protein
MNHLQTYASISKISKISKIYSNKFYTYGSYKTSSMLSLYGYSHFLSNSKKLSLNSYPHHSSKGPTLLITSYPTKVYYSPDNNDASNKKEQIIEIVSTTISVLFFLFILTSGLYYYYTNRKHASLKCDNKVYLVEKEFPLDIVVLGNSSNQIISPMHKFSKKYNKNL